MLLVSTTWIGMIFWIIEMEMFVGIGGTRWCVISVYLEPKHLQNKYRLFLKGRGTDKWSVPSTVLVPDQPEVKKCKDRAPVQQEERRPEL
ncbi:hypothetical protein F2Q70_00022594 [Brassica cretica]|uniref:Uncharacterized protein n=1 Tax=Brassica cretica TaxID=69181 RepID=A0A8S9GT87_BRACR|nr:hypothetical protein F2Q70_00022594 [Brassica cretica]